VLQLELVLVEVWEKESSGMALLVVVLTGALVGRWDKVLVYALVGWWEKVLQHVLEHVWFRLNCRSMRCLVCCAVGWLVEVSEQK
jgi:hypothetical protein